MLCVEYTSANPSRAYILPDVQYFSGVGNVGKVEINQQVSIENTNIVLSSISPTANAVLFTGDGVKAIKIENRQQSIKSNLESSKVEDRAVGFIAPNIVGKDLHPNMNTLINLHHMKGKYIFIDIWSTFCPPCIADFPNLKKVYDNFKRDKFDIIGIVDERVKNLSQKILDERGIYWPNLLTSGKENQLTGYLHIYEYPTTYLVDPTGRIIASGLDAQGLMSKLSVLLNKK
ncbi:MAG: TlpA family protein disulfide reductase [Chryseobacterium sp.]|nr:MAG: TlpA family protein disulfide reductase [Chryseobacterium sp.]